MTKSQIDKLSSEVAINVHHTLVCISIPEILNYLNDKGMLHPPHDDTFLWDKEILEAEYPKICAEIRADERRKVIDTIKWNIEELASEDKE